MAVWRVDESFGLRVEDHKVRNLEMEEEIEEIEGIYDILRLVCLCMVGLFKVILSHGGGFLPLLIPQFSPRFSFEYIPLMSHLIVMSCCCCCCCILIIC